MFGFGVRGEIIIKDMTIKLGKNKIRSGFKLDFFIICSIDTTGNQSLSDQEKKR